MPQSSDRRLFGHSQQINGLTYSIYVSGPANFPLLTMPGGGFLVDQFMPVMEAHSATVQEKIRAAQIQRQNEAAAKSEAERAKREALREAEAKKRSEGAQS